MKDNRINNAKVESLFDDIVVIMQHNGIIEQKLAFLDKYISNLEKEFSNVTLEKFQNNWAMQRMTERSLQVMVEIVIDISQRIIALKGEGPVASSSESIEKLVAFGVLESKDPYIHMVRFRNLVVHQYEEIDTEIMYTIVKNKLNSFRNFRDEIDKW